MRETRLIKMLAAGAACAMALNAAFANCDDNMEIYGHAPDGSTLQWVRHTPPSEWGTGPWPAVVVVHGGGFHGGHPSDAGVIQVCQDLSGAGYLCFAITYRLAQNLICHQPETNSDGRRTGVAGPGPNIHDQMDDVRKAIRTARGDSDCNGTVYGLGGSAGGTHVLFAAITGTVGVDKPDAAVGMSGPYDGSDLRGLPSPNPPAIRSFVEDWERYVGYGNVGDPGVQSPLHDPPRPGQVTSMRNASPVSQPIANVPPVLLINGDSEPMPVQQVTDMVWALNNVGITFTNWPDTSSLYQKNIINSSAHSFDNWGVKIDGDYTVKDEVIDFLNSLTAQ